MQTQKLQCPQALITAERQWVHANSWHSSANAGMLPKVRKNSMQKIGDKSTELYLLVRVERCTCSPFSTGFTLSHLDLLISSTTVIRLCNVSWLQKITATKHSTLYNKSNKHHMVHIRDIKSQSLHTLNELYRMVLVMKGERFVYEFHSSANWLHILGTSVIE